jgi:hypothetical protein
MLGLKQTVYAAAANAGLGGLRRATPSPIPAESALLRAPCDSERRIPAASRIISAVLFTN